MYASTDENIFLLFCGMKIVITFNDSANPELLPIRVFQIDYTSI